MKLKNAIKKTMLVLAAAMLIASTAGAVSADEADVSVDTQKENEAAPEPTRIPVSESEEDYEELPETFILYLSGIDVWGALETQSRSDVNILVAVNSRTGKILLVNTPRDYYVELPISNGMRDKLTHAGIYGPEVSKGALEMLYGVPIDYFARLNFSGFEAIIDALGGIDVYSEYDFTVDPIKHYEQGMNHLTGLESLAFVRERKAFTEGDVQRGKNQMEMVKALITRLGSFEAMKNFDEVYEAVGYFAQTNMDRNMLFALAADQILKGRTWDIETAYVTGFGGTEVTYSMPGTAAYVMWPNEDEVAEVKEKLQAVLEE